MPSDEALREQLRGDHAVDLASVTIEKGMIIRTEGGATGNVTHDDGYTYGVVRRTEPDRDGDIRACIIQPDGEVRGTANYFRVSRCEYLPNYKTQRQPDDEIEARLESDREAETHLAVLEEEEENLVQMQEIQARTVEPGVLQLPVKQVTSAKNSQQWAIIVDHPVLGEMRFYREKPLAGWSRAYDIVTLLESYGIYDANVYKLQTREVYVELTGEDATMDSNWALRQPEEIGSTSDGGDSPSPSVVIDVSNVVMSAIVVVMLLVGIGVAAGAIP